MNLRGLGGVPLSGADVIDPPTSALRVILVSPLPTGTNTVGQGQPPWSQTLTDGPHGPVAVTPPFVAPSAADPALVVGFSPNGPVTANQGTAAAVSNSWPVKGGILAEVTGSAAALNADCIASTDISDARWVSLQITGTFSGTLTYQVSNDNSTFVATVLLDSANAAGNVSTTSLITRLVHGPVVAKYFRVRMTAFTSGQAVCRLETYASTTMRGSDVDRTAAATPSAVRLTDATAFLGSGGTGTGLTVEGTFWQTTQPVSGPLTDTELRATPVPISGTVTLTDGRHGPVAVTAPFHAATQADPGLVVAVAPGGTVTADQGMGARLANAWLTLPGQSNGTANNASTGHVYNNQTTGVADTAVTATFTQQPGTQWRLISASAYCSAGTASLTVADGGTTIWSTPAGAVGTTLSTFNWTTPLMFVGVAPTVTLGTCGAANTGTLIIQAARF